MLLLTISLDNTIGSYYCSHEERNCWTKLKQWTVWYVCLFLVRVFSSGRPEVTSNYGMRSVTRRATHDARLNSSTANRKEGGQSSVAGRGSSDGTTARRHNGTMTRRTDEWTYLHASALVHSYTIHYSVDIWLRRCCKRMPFLSLDTRSPTRQDN